VRIISGKNYFSDGERKEKLEERKKARDRVKKGSALEKKEIYFVKKGLSH